ncbi:hypothetical protein HMPREF9123_0762 [Neisseria bacilliformis ATCC BAA-1200]|uniref:Uncharacterized protein n=1 Tax=Neisseria bacilliformis ATCC BAA-1200 TaxID=888742 RepID=F2BAN1_9NEIS|nr:hypothetical protein HMPREF9123_0762 [Neisseria bacilliformis ATCC BAA-1200]
MPYGSIRGRLKIPQMRFSDGLLPVIDKIGAAPRGVAPPRAMIRIRSAIQKTARKT